MQKGYRIGQPSFLEETDYLNKYTIREAKVKNYEIEKNKLAVTLQFPSFLTLTYKLDLGVNRDQTLSTHTNILGLEHQEIIHAYFHDGINLVGVTSREQGYDGDITSRFN